jgi:alpha-L-fucosidase 2
VAEATAQGARLLQTARQLQPILPPLPLGNITGKDNYKNVCTDISVGPRMLSVLPAELFGRTTNNENPELYAVHPFRLLCVNRSYDASAAVQAVASGDAFAHGGIWDPPNVTSAEALGRTTYERRRFPSAVGEWQDVVQAANLGLAEEALAMVRSRFALGAVAPVSTPDPSSTVIFAEGAPDHAMRFPSFYGLVRIDHNSFPDDEHPALARNALQNMLVQPDGRRLLLVPAWGAGWPDVDFKLQAPMNTTVEARCVGGQLQGLRVTPAERARDVVQLGCGASS